MVTSFIVLFLFLLSIIYLIGLAIYKFIEDKNNRIIEKEVKRIIKTRVELFKINALGTYIYMM